MLNFLSGLVLMSCFQIGILAFDWNFLIYPGTKWCGKGDKAISNDDLGRLDRVDACCRTHDKCDIKIGALSSGYGIFNPYPSTVVHCDCDDALKQCFLDVSGSQKAHAITLGLAFFKSLSLPCIDDVHPRICRKRILGICVSWNDDTSRTNRKLVDGPSYRDFYWAMIT